MHDRINDWRLAKTETASTCRPISPSDLPVNGSGGLEIDSTPLEKSKQCLLLSARLSPHTYLNKYFSPATPLARACQRKNERPWWSREEKGITLLIGRLAERVAFLWIAAIARVYGGRFAEPPKSTLLASSGTGGWPGGRSLVCLTWRSYMIKHSTLGHTSCLCPRVSIIPFWVQTYPSFCKTQEVCFHLWYTIKCRVVCEGVIACVCVCERKIIKAYKFTSWMAGFFLSQQTHLSCAQASLKIQSLDL